MSDQHREIINRHWFLLHAYINPTNDLITKLVSEKVLPTSMADDIRAGENQSVKNDRLLKSLKIVGSVAFKKFRHILLEHGHAFLAELLWDDDQDSGSFIEECDFNGYPSFNSSMNPMERKQLIWLLNSKVNSRLMQSEWKKNSEERLKKLRARIDHDVNSKEDLKKTITRLNAELTAKNEMLKNMVRDYNLLNDDVTNFEKRHNLGTKIFLSRSVGSGDNKSNNKECAMEAIPLVTIKNSRFKFMDKLIGDMDQRLSTLLGEGEAKPYPSIDDVSEKTKRLKSLVRELEVKVDRHTGEEKQVRDLLFPSQSNDDGTTLLQFVDKFLSQEQTRRFALLGDVDKLSKKLRGITDEDPNSAIKGLRQSAVTGNPAPETVDFRFLRNHIALLMAEADHMAKKISWKEEEERSSVSELETAGFRVSKASSKRILRPIEFPRR